MKKRATIMLIAMFSIVTLNACSTIEGAGKDLQGAGQAISNEANRIKRS